MHVCVWQKSEGRVVPLPSSLQKVLASHHNANGWPIDVLHGNYANKCWGGAGSEGSEVHVAHADAASEFNIDILASLFVGMAGIISSSAGCSFFCSLFVVFLCFFRKRGARSARFFFFCNVDEGFVLGFRRIASSISARCLSMHTYMPDLVVR